LALPALSTVTPVILSESSSGIGIGAMVASTTPIISDRKALSTVSWRVTISAIVPAAFVVFCATE
jgi:hypothetical protein